MRLVLESRMYALYSVTKDSEALCLLYRSLCMFQPIFSYTQEALDPETPNSLGSFGASMENFQ